MKKTIITIIAATALSITSTAYATGATSDQVCGPLDSGKIDTTGDPQTVTVTAPDGQLIDGYCVKAGSDKQGDGPVYVTVDPPVKTITFGHPSGKDVSHYSVSYVPVVTTPPTPTETPTTPTETPTTPTPTSPTETPTETPTTPAPTTTTITETPTVTPTTPPTTPTEIPTTPPTSTPKPEPKDSSVVECKDGVWVKTVTKNGHSMSTSSGTCGDNSVQSVPLEDVKEEGL